MAYYELNGKTIYIDDLLQRQLDKKVIPNLKRKDMDAVYVTDGRERIGKSVFAMAVGGYIASRFKTKFDLSNICLNPMEFKERIEKSKKNEVVIYDEAHRGMGSANALSEVNKILKNLMMEMGQKNLFVMIVLPTFFLLERYVALFRASGLFHIYMNKNARGYWAFFNEKNKKRLYLGGRKDFNYNCMKWPGFRGRFYDQYVIDEEGYRKKKSISFKEAPRKSRHELSTENLKKVAYMLHEEKQFGKLTMKQIGDLFKMYGILRSRATIGLDIKEMREKQGKVVLS